uniref:Methyltransferase n=1 Tax=Nelumbo nucifera TaxID=4432 RepID=A0A822ZTQ6_NELNU|nr:TPA_asm: hypothetical protein HUJ06_016848 [Nelumbo nucifera]
MAFGKARSSKRSPSSYTSTVTMVIFIAICVIGLWMLTSSFIPRQTTSTANDLSSSTNSRTHYQHKDPPAFEDSQGDLPDVEPKQMVEMSNYDSKSREDKQSSVLLPENRSDPVVEGNAEDETELENIEASNDDGNPKSSNNEEHEKDQSSLEEENTVETQQRKEESADVEQQAKEESETEEIQEIYAQSEQQTTEVQSTERTQQDTQQETAEMESQENTDLSRQQISQEDHQEISDFQNAEIHEGISEPEIRQVMNEETVLQEQQESEQQDETTDNEESQQSERTEAEKQEGHQSEENDNSSNQETQQQEQDILTEEKEMDLNSGESFLGEAQSETQQQGIMTEEKAATDLNSGGESFPGGAHPEIPKESTESKQSWSTQAVQSENEKERRKEGPNGIDRNLYGYTWELCNVTAGPDYIPCLDNEKALKKLHSTRHYEHRERHCPDEAPTCLVPLPDGYKRSIEWPKSRDKIWYHNVPRTKLAEVKGHQNWVKVTGEFLTFPGGGTQFIHGALHYIDFIQQSVPKIGWGKRSRVILDVGCGVASFGGYLFEREVLTMSFAPKDEHEAQVQFALERGIPAMSAVMGSQRLPFPSRVFDLVHCARCRVPWHADGL